MNQRTYSKIAKIKDEWFATSIAYLFPNDDFYWAPDSKSRSCQNIDQAKINEVNTKQSAYVICKK
jgi:hypothetical protein